MATLKSQLADETPRQPEVQNHGLAAFLVHHDVRGLEDPVYDPAVVSLGCGQLHPHMVSEALRVIDFEDACRVALRLATAVP